MHFYEGRFGDVRIRKSILAVANPVNFRRLRNGSMTFFC